MRYPENELFVFEGAASANYVNRGFLYQYYATLDLWLQKSLASEKVRIFCETFDDIAIFNKDLKELSFQQIKCYSSNFSINSKSLRNSIINFFRLHLKFHQQRKLKYVFFSSSGIKPTEYLLRSWIDEAGEISPPTMNLCISWMEDLLRKDAGDEFKDLLNSEKTMTSPILESFIREIHWQFEDLSPEKAIEALKESCIARLRSFSEVKLDSKLLLARLIFEVHTRSSQQLIENRCLTPELLREILNESLDEVQETLSSISVFPAFAMEFQEVMELYTQSFIGRSEEQNFLLDRIRDLEQGFIYLQGVPGIGKTSLVTRLISKLEENELINESFILVKYFIVRGTIKDSAGHFLKFMNQSLQNIAPINRPVSAKDFNENLEFLFERLQNFSQQSNGKQLLIFIDGIDEGEGKDWLSALIVQCFPRVLIIYSGRPTKEVLSLIGRIKPQFLLREEIKGLTQKEIVQFLQKYIPQIPLDQYPTVIRASEGNPLYLKLLESGVKNGSLQLIQSGGVPDLSEDFDAFYQLFFWRWGEMEQSDLISRVLMTISIAKDPVSASQLQLICNSPSFATRKVLNTLREVLIMENFNNENVFRLFHETLRNYINQNWKGEQREMELQIIQHGLKWNHFADLSYGKNVSSYVANHLPTHLKDLGHEDQLIDLAKLPEFFQFQMDHTNDFRNCFNLFDWALTASLKGNQFDGSMQIVSNLVFFDGKIKDAQDSILEMVQKWGSHKLPATLFKVSKLDKEDQLKHFIDLLHWALIDHGQDSRGEVKLILECMEENHSQDPSILNWYKFVPIGYLFFMIGRIAHMGIDPTPIFKNFATDFNFKGDEIIILVDSMDDIELDLIHRFMGMIENDSDKDKFLDQLCREYAKAGNDAKAWEILGSIEKKYKRNNFLFGVVAELAKLEEFDRVGSFLEHRKLKYSDAYFSELKDYLLEEIPPERAVEKLLKYPHLQLRSCLVANHANSLIWTRSFSNLLPALLEIEDKGTQNMLIESAIEALLREDDLETAESLVDQLSLNPYWDNSMSSLAKAACETGDIQKAKDFSSRCKDAEIKTHTLLSLSRCCFQKGESLLGEQFFQQANKLYQEEQIKEDSFFIFWYAWALACSKRLDQALLWANKIGHNSRRGYLLGHIYFEFAKAEGWENIKEELAEKIDPGLLQKIHYGIAECYGKEGDFEMSNHVAQLLDPKGDHHFNPDHLYCSLAQNFVEKGSLTEGSKWAEKIQGEEQLVDFLNAFFKHHLEEQNMAACLEILGRQAEFDSRYKSAFHSMERDFFQAFLNSDNQELLWSNAEELKMEPSFLHHLWEIRDLEALLIYAKRCSGHGHERLELAIKVLENDLPDMGIEILKTIEELSYIGSGVNFPLSFLTANPTEIIRLFQICDSNSSDWRFIQRSALKLALAERKMEAIDLTANLALNERLNLNIEVLCLLAKSTKDYDYGKTAIPLLRKMDNVYSARQALQSLAPVLIRFEQYRELRELFHLSLIDEEKQKKKEWRISLDQWFKPFRVSLQQGFLEEAASILAEVEDKDLNFINQQTELVRKYIENDQIEKALNLLREGVNNAFNLPLRKDLITSILIDFIPLFNKCQSMAESYPILGICEGYLQAEIDEGDGLALAPRQMVNIISGYFHHQKEEAAINWFKIFIQYVNQLNSDPLGQLSFAFRDLYKVLKENSYKDLAHSILHLGLLYHGIHDMSFQKNLKLDPMVSIDAISIMEIKKLQRFFNGYGLSLDGVENLCRYIPLLDASGDSEIGDQILMVLADHYKEMKKGKDKSATKREIEVCNGVRGSGEEKIHALERVREKCSGKDFTQALAKIGATFKGEEVKLLMKYVKDLEEREFRKSGYLTLLQLIEENFGREKPENHLKELLPELKFDGKLLRKALSIYELYDAPRLKK